MKEVAIALDSTSVDEAIEKTKQLKTLLQEVRELLQLFKADAENKQTSIISGTRSIPIKCLCQHFAAFFDQCCEEKQADFGEACVKCSELPSCRREWQNKILPLAKANGVHVKLAR